MTRPTIYLVRMLVFLLAVAAVAGFLADRLIVFFANNPVLNGLIFLVGLIGIGWNLRQVIRLGREVRWLSAFQSAPARAQSLPAPRLLAPMASMLAARAAQSDRRLSLSAATTSSLLDSLASRLDESRELSRYMTGLLIFLGLLGTFWGLLLTVGAVGDVVGGLTVGGGDMQVMFDQLKSGLARPLHGMGTAFSSSMFGLTGALVLGFLDLTAGQAQNRFFNELEEWLAGSTQLSSGLLGQEGEAPVPVYVQALLEATAENMQDLQRVLTRGEHSRHDANHAVLGLTERIATLSDTLRANQQLMLRVAEAQAALGPALGRLAEERAAPEGERTLRTIEQLLQRLVSETEQGRERASADFRLLTRTVASMSAGLGAPPPAGAGQSPALPS